MAGVLGESLVVSVSHEMKCKSPQNIGENSGSKIRGKVRDENSRTNSRGTVVLQHFCPKNLAEKHQVGKSRRKKSGNWGALTKSGRARKIGEYPGDPSPTSPVGDARLAREKNMAGVLDRGLC